jgi:Tol biopolymer transport system component/DNA-binding winged helix-turn-helix (wHTH) protein
MSDASRVAGTPIRVGEFLLDPSSGELRSDTGRQSLSAQPLQVLLALLERPRELVTRDELRQRLWPAGTYVDFEHGLNAVVKRLRDALGDSADTPRYVETVPRRGYRLIAAVGRGVPDSVARPPDLVPPAPDPAAPAAPPPTSGSTPVRSRRRLGLTALVVAALALGALASMNLRRQAQAAFAVAPPTAQDAKRLTFGPGLQTGATWSPDGRRLAFAWDRDGNFDIFTQSVQGGEPTRIASTPSHDTQPAWSPDGQRVVFRSEGADGGLFTVSADGGPVRRITSAGHQPRWMPDGRDIVFSGTEVQALYLVRADGGEPPREILKGQLSGGAWSSVAVHPDGRIGVLGIHPVRRFGFYVVDRANRTLQPVDTKVALSFGWQTAFGRLHWNPAGTALFVEATIEGVPALWRVPVDPVTLAWQTPVRLTTGLASADRAAVSPDGTRLAFTSAQSTTQAWVFPFDADAGRSPGQGRALTDEDASVGALSLAADGSALYYVEQRPGQTQSRGMRADLATGQARAIVGPTCGGPVPSRSGRLVAYELERTSDASAGDFEYALAVRDLQGGERLVAAWGRGAFMPSDWSHDDRAVLGTAMKIAFTGSAQLAEWPTDGAQVVAPSRVLLSSPTTQFWQGRYSPDHRWVSFVALSLADDRPVELGIAPAHSRAAAAWTRVAADHAWPDKPRWSPDGRTLYFLSSASGGFVNLWGVHIDPTSGAQRGAAFQVTHLDSPRWHVDPDMELCEMGIAKDRLVLPMRVVKGSIWMISAGVS